MSASDHSAAEIAATLTASIGRRERFDEPYRHYLLTGLFPEQIAAELAELPFVPPSIDGVSGKRELHNDTRRYFDAAAMARYPVMQAVAEALQDRSTVRRLAEAFEAAIDQTYLRLEYALDVDGFWLEPHTDLGVKKFTCLIYLSDGPDHEMLGTDIYWSKERHFGRSPFARNTAMVFIPAGNTWHGFERRPITGVRKSVIFNYVTDEWRAREQLSFPQQPVQL
jgi:hypothetical protein